MAVPHAARALALLIPAALLAGAWGFQLVAHLVPCEMCHWQRWPHYAALVVALAAFAFTRAARPLVIGAALLIAASGAIAAYHAGVEYHWWAGRTACTASGVLAGDTPAERFAALMRQPIVRCDQPQWTWGGVSLAGFNAVFSLAGAATILALVRRRMR